MLKDGTITQEQYDGLQREIAETKAKLKSLEEQAKSSATALQEIAAKLKTVGENVTSVGKKFLPVTAGVVGLGTAAVKTAADFDSAMSKVAAVSGATGAEGTWILCRRKQNRRRRRLLKSVRIMAYDIQCSPYGTGGF